MAAGFGQIALGRKKAQSMFSKGTSQAPQLAYQMGTQKRQEDSAYRNEMLQSLAVLGTGFKQKEQSWGEFTSGAERAGVDLGEDITKPGFVEKIKRGIGISKVPLGEQYTFGDESKQMSGAELLNIGERKRLGTLESFLEGKEIGDVFGSKSKGFQAYEAVGQEGVSKSTAAAGGRSWEDFRDKQIKGMGVGTDYADEPSFYKSKSYERMMAAERGETIDMGGDFKEGDTFTSLGRDITVGKYGQPDKDREYAESPSDKIYREATYTQEGKRRTPDDPMKEQRAQYASGVEQGVFAEGTKIEDWWSEQDRAKDLTALPSDSPKEFDFSYLDEQDPNYIAQQQRDEESFKAVSQGYGDPHVEESMDDKMAREREYDYSGGKVTRDLPDDPKGEQRARYASGVEQGVFAEGTTVEDWWKSQSKTVAPQRPRVEPDVEEADYEGFTEEEDESLANWNEAMKYQQNLPADPSSDYYEGSLPNILPYSPADTVTSPAGKSVKGAGGGKPTAMGQVVEPDTQSFGEAFKAANKLFGDIGEFIWQGKSFTSKRA